MDIWLILRIIDGIMFSVILITVVYIFIFSIAGLFNKHQEVPRSKRQNRFIILIPSYKQDKIILNTVSSILGQTYPQRLFDVVVISDHQSEVTNMRLAQYPITLLTPNFEQSTKAKSLQYAILNLPEFKIYDVAIILDASNLVEPEFLSQVNDAFEAAGTKAIQLHRLPQNRDTPSARLDSIFEEINNSIFRRGHIFVGLSAAMMGSGVAYDFNWFRDNIMKVRTASEDKELEALLMRQHVFIDYFDNIHVFDEKTRDVMDFNRQRGRWAYSQLRGLVLNIRFLPIAIINRHYDLVDKIIQWMLIPRMILAVLIGFMSIVMPFVYFSLAVKWWFTAAIMGLAFAIATPDNLVDKNWNKDFLTLPLRTIFSLLKIDMPTFTLPNISIKLPWKK